MTHLLAKLRQTSYNTWILKFVGEADPVSNKLHFLTWFIDNPSNGQSRPLKLAAGKELSFDLAALEPADAAEIRLSLTIQHITEEDYPQSPPAQVTLLGGWLPSPHTNGEASFNYPIYLPDTHQKLTRREVEILGLLANGATNRAIAEQLVISRNTVKTHLKHLRRKLAATSRAEVVSRARELGVL